MPNGFIEMEFDEWCATYKPIVNHLDENASFDNGEGGIMFETYGDEVAFVKSQSPANIWMYGSGDDGGTYVWNGWGFVNRLGYFITEVPCPDGLTIQVQVGEPDLTCDDCGDIIEEDETHNCEETLMQDNPTNEVEQEDEYVLHTFGEKTVQL
jgi:hypothetical protein